VGMIDIDIGKLMNLLWDPFKGWRKARALAKAWKPYKMFEPYPGTKVWHFTAPAGSDMLDHDACPNCRSVDGKISILQAKNDRVYHCPACGSLYRFKADPPVRPQQRRVVSAF